MASTPIPASSSSSLLLSDVKSKPSLFMKTSLPTIVLADRSNLVHLSCLKTLAPTPTIQAFRRINAVPGDVVTSEIEASKEVVSSAGDDGVSTIISALLFVAFIGLSILTVGVIYLGVTDFLQKREREKFEKEEDANKKGRKKNKNKKVRSRAGPRGFGQKNEED